MYGDSKLLGMMPSPVVDAKQQLLLALRWGVLSNVERVANGYSDVDNGNQKISQSEYSSSLYFTEQLFGVSAAVGFVLLSCSKQQLQARQKWGQMFAVGLSFPKPRKKRSDP